MTRESDPSLWDRPLLARNAHAEAASGAGLADQSDKLLATAGLDEETVRACIRNQEQKDDRYDQLKSALSPLSGGSRVTSAFAAPRQ